MIALAWTWFGAWLILPFAGVEIAALAAALIWNARHAGDYERISLTDGRLIVEIRESARISRYEFNPLWVKLVTRGAGTTSTLRLRSHGRELEIGRHLDETGRRRLAAEFRRWLRVAHG